MSEVPTQSLSPFTHYRDTIDDIIGFDDGVDEKKAPLTDCGSARVSRDFDTSRYTLERVYPAGDDCKVITKRLHIDLVTNSGRLVETERHSSDDKTEGEVIADFALEGTHYDWTEDAEEIIELLTTELDSNE